MNQPDRIKFNNYFFWGFTLFLFGSCSSCVSRQISAVQNESNLQPIQNIYTRPVQQNNSSEKGETFINESGWKIPDLSSSEVTKFNPKSDLKGVGKITLNIKKYEPSTNIVTDEPFASINESLGQIRYLTINEYSVNNHIFCYKIQANRVTVDEKTGSISYSSGSLFFFSYYDENGDGIFETLALDEIGQSGFSSFYNPPHIPKWVLQKN